MRTWLARTAVAAAAAGFAACAPAAAPLAPPPKPPPVAPAPAPAQQPDLSPVGEPLGLVALAHARNLAVTLDAAGRMVRLPLSLSRLAEEELRNNGRDMIKLDAGFDAAFALDPTSSDSDPKVLGAFSLPVSAVDRALQRLEQSGEEFVPIAPGVFRGLIKDDEEQAPPTPESDAEESGGDRSEPMQCDLAVSLGDAPARLVCADSARELDLLRPWLTRGMPLARFGDADLHAEVRFSPVQARYSGVLRSQADSLSLAASQWLETEASVRDPVLLRAPGDVLQEGVRFVDDLDTFTIDMSLDPNAMQVSTRGKLRFKGRSSWLTRVLTEPNDKAAPPPPIFWRAPKDSATVTLARGVDPRHYDGIKQVLLTATSSLLPRTPLSARTRSAVEEFVAAMPLHKADVVSARGSIPPASKRKAGDPRKPADAVVEAKDLANQYMGWSLAGVDAPAAEYAAWLRKGASLYDRLLQDARSDKDFRKHLDELRVIPSVKVVDSPTGLPRGSVAVDCTIRFDSKDVWNVSLLGANPDAAEHPAGAVARGSVTLRMAVIPDGPNRTWIAASTDLATLRTRVASVMSGAPESGTIASLPELAPLRSTAVTSVGIVVYGGIVDQTLQSLRASDPKWTNAAVDQALAALPNRLRTPLVIIGSGTGGPTPSNEVEIRVLRGTIQDLAGLIAFAITDKGRGLFQLLDRDRAAP